MSTPSNAILKCYSTASALAGKAYPYVYGGGHPGFGPSGGGYDCSGWVSAILHGGGVLGHTEALDTHALEKWGLSGPGEFMTVWVINEPDINHTFLEFHLSGRHRWSAARHTGTTCGWATKLYTEGYTPRRRK